MSSGQVPLMNHPGVKSVGTETSSTCVAWEEEFRLRCGPRHECVSKLRDPSIKALVLLLPLKIKANPGVYNFLY
ncbi:hypothetical protein TNCV_3675881 [Trichonephila clavipes]|nr:hypothetical protein TNCV_3675881 [Trichonephila clavipes]